MTDKEEGWADCGEWQKEGNEESFITQLKHPGVQGRWKEKGGIQGEGSKEGEGEKEGGAENRYYLETCSHSERSKQGEIQS